MHRKSNTFGILLAFAVLLSLTVGMVAAAPVTQSITYQGKLTDAAGNPLTGSYTVLFSLYEASAGGAALATDTHSVTATKGLFTTQITADSKLFDGRALWLGIKVGSDPEMTPRQELRPVPYALGLRPGAVGASFTTREAGTPDYKLAGVNVSTLYNYNPGVQIRSDGDFSAGVIAHTDGYHSYGLDSLTEGDNSLGVHALTTGTNSPGVVAYTLGTNSPGVIASTTNASSNGMNAFTEGTNSHGVWASVSGPDSHGIFAYSAQDAAVYGIGKEGGQFTTSTAGGPGNSLVGVNVSTLYDYNPGVKIRTYGNLSRGLTVETDGQYSHGLSAITNGNLTRGVYAATVGDHSDGVVVFTYGPFSNGVKATTYNASSNGVDAVTSGDNSYGVRSVTAGSGSNAIYAESSHTSTPAIYATSKGSNSWAVYAKTDCGGCNALVGETTADGPAAIAGLAGGVNSWGVYARSVKSHGVYAETYDSNSYGFYTPDRLYAGGAVFPTADVAEYMPVTGNPTPGTVVIIGPEGKLQPSTTAYDSRVAGIVSTAPGITLGAKEEGNPGEAIIAVSGRVPCTVDASAGPIHSGDLLTTSDTPGYAMKAEPTIINGRGFYPDGTILGKAMGTLESGTGTIEVLVTLQ